ncbi:MAG: Tetratricopeptide repeat [Bradyrhizobium sp.]|nr:Tetratricopeptide repeat [Bradyrhizobium sp.]
MLKARAGQMAEAQAALRAMLAAGTDDGLVAMDLTTLLQQGGKPAEAVAVFEKAGHADAPDHTLLAATRAYRDLRRYDDAAQLAREGMRRFPDDTVWPLLLSLILSDGGRPAEALEILGQPAAERAAGRAPVG